MTWDQILEQRKKEVEGGYYLGEKIRLIGAGEDEFLGTVKIPVFSGLRLLPENHELRNLPLGEGASFRTWRTFGQDITVPFEERGEDWSWHGWSKWKRVLSSWKKLGHVCYNDLGPAWTENTDWKYDKTQHLDR